MNSLYYIAPKKRLDRFDELFDQLDILATPFPAETIRSLTAFIKGERAIAQQNYIVIDVGDLTRWSSGHVLSAVQYLRSFATVKPIFIGEPCEAVDDMFRCLRDTHRIDDVILASADADNVPTALKELLTAEPADAPARAEHRERPAPLSPAEKLTVARQTTQSEMPIRKYHAEEGKLIRFAVAGTMPRCGTTTQAFGLYHYLTAVGLSGAIEDRAGTLPLLSRYETVTETKHGGQSVRGVCFITPDASTGAYDFIITDYGVLAEETAAAFCKADVSVLVGCTKPWELPAFAAAVGMLFGYPCARLITVASFSTDTELKKLERYLGEHYAAAPWQPDIWRLVNSETYRKLFTPVLDELCAGYAIEEGVEYGG